MKSFVAVDASTGLINARNALFESLGTDQSRYLALLKNWFSQKISKDDFDQGARLFLTSSQIRLHNVFLLAVLDKFHATSGVVGQRKRKLAATASKYDRFSLIKSPLLITSHQRPIDSTIPSISNEGSQRSCLQLLPLPVAQYKQEGYMLGSDEIGGRIIVSCWMNGIDDLEVGVSSLVHQAMSQMLKNLLTSVILMRRSFYRRPGDGLLLEFGCERPTGLYLDSTDGKAVFPVPVKSSGKLSLRDLYYVLKNDRSGIPSRQLVHLILEMLLCRLSHPSDNQINAEVMIDKL